MDEPNPKFKQGLNTGLTGRQYVLNYYVNDSKKRLKALDDYTNYKYAEWAKYHKIGHFMEDFRFIF